MYRDPWWNTPYCDPPVLAFAPRVHISRPQPFRADSAAIPDKLTPVLSWRATYLFESNRLTPFSTQRIRQIIHQYAAAAGIEKRVYLHLFRHQIITYLTRKGIINPKL
jgi:integrase